MCYVTQGEGRGFFEICDKALHGGGTGGLKLGKKLLRNLWMAPYGYVKDEDAAGEGVGDAEQITEARNGNYRECK